MLKKRERLIALGHNRIPQHQRPHAVATARDVGIVGGGQADTERLPSDEAGYPRLDPVYTPSISIVPAFFGLGVLLTIMWA